MTDYLKNENIEVCVLADPDDIQQVWAPARYIEPAGDQGTHHRVIVPGYHPGPMNFAARDIRRPADGPRTEPGPGPYFRPAMTATPFLELPDDPGIREMLVAHIVALPRRSEVLITGAEHTHLQGWFNLIEALPDVEVRSHRLFSAVLQGGTQVTGRLFGRDGTGIKGVHPDMIIVVADDIPEHAAMELTEIARDQCRPFVVTRFRSVCNQAGCVKIEGNFEVGTGPEQHTVHRRIHTHVHDRDPFKAMIGVARDLDDHIHPT